MKLSTILTKIISKISGRLVTLNLPSLWTACCFAIFIPCHLAAQDSVLNLTRAVQIGLNNYQNIAAKRNYVGASVALSQNTKNQYLPDVTASIQQVYGTVNGQIGPAISIGSPGLSSSGPTWPSQSWNSAFGGVYLLTSNWEFVSFGRLRSKIDAAGKQVMLDSFSLNQEKFVTGVKIAGTYLNLLIAQRLVENAQSNVDRAESVRQSVMARTLSGLNAGVDSSIAIAELSGARLSLIQAVNFEQQVLNQLAQLLNAPPVSIPLDTSFFSRTPSTYSTTSSVADNPQAKYYQSRIDLSQGLSKYLQKSINPGLNLFGTFQSRASGFDYNYLPGFDDRYSKNYFDGVNPNRYNYVFGLGLAWNIISPLKIKQQVKAQQLISDAYANEYDLVTTQLKDQLILSDQQIENSIRSVREAPLQLKAASDAYVQKTALYRNGLSNIVDVQQALFTLNKAQTDLSVAYINVWQALLLKAAASGDFDLFMKQVK